MNEMELLVINAIHLSERLLLHQDWLATSNQGLESVAGSPLRLVDELVSNVTMINEDLANAEIVGCELSHVYFENCDLSHADLTGTVFMNCSFVACSFIKADLKKLQGQGVDFSRSDFSRADFTDASLIDANLTDCVLDWTWLVRTDLRHATLERTSFVGARLSETKLSNDRKFALGSTARAVADKVELTLESGDTAIVGVDVFELINYRLS